ncbi:MAG: HAD family hydrolase [Sulfuricurvum sp.]|jgi:phosphoglycolate phosphatase|uniref:HAD family hydrolase n=1 Tax=Sulfuricurvum sp. TaxID=2025608 RepID=UPI0025CC5842|nr:HAD family hydrolase [Sulfuricurvum sp.]MCK9372948.1 HAD family hydrolase [Sulfuricurvum sp.]
MGRIAIFDMDGTLIDSGRDITLSINYVRERCYGLPPLSITEVVDAINAPCRNLSEIFYATTTYEASARNRFEEHYYDQCIQNVTSYEGIEDVLKYLTQQGFSMGVATNAPGIFARRMLNHLGLSDFFSLIVGADDVQTPKPHPQMLQKILEYHAFDSGTDYAWMIGDNSKDMEAAEQAGILGIFAGWGFSSQGAGDYFAEHPKELLRIITEGK